MRVGKSRRGQFLFRSQKGGSKKNKAGMRGGIENF